MAHDILVFGGTGTVGSGLVRILKTAGHNVRIATRKSPTEPGQVRLDPLKGEGLDAAFAGVDRAFFLSPTGLPDQYAVLAPLIAKAREAKLRKVVLMTAIGVEHAEGTPLRRAEIDLENSGLAWNIIRPQWFSQNFANFWGHDIRTLGALRLPAGDGKAAFIDARDISAVAAKLLTSDAFDNQAFTLTGPESLDHHQAAKILSEAAGKPVVYRDITPEEFRANLLAAGVTPEYTEILVFLLGVLKAGHVDVTTDAVEKITGRKPRSLREYARDAAEAWR